MGGVRLRKIAMATEHLEERRKWGGMSGFNLPGFMASKFKMRQHPFTPLQNGA
jgi:hypothetical protein